MLVSIYGPRSCAILKRTACIITFCAQGRIAAGSRPGLEFRSGEIRFRSSTIKIQTRDVWGLPHFAFRRGVVEIGRAGTEGMTIETDDNILPLLETVVENGTLKIRPRQEILRSEPGS